MTYGYTNRFPNFRRLYINHLDLSIQLKKCLIQNLRSVQNRSIVILVCLHEPDIWINHPRKSPQRKNYQYILTSNSIFLNLPYNYTFVDNLSYRTKVSSPRRRKNGGLGAWLHNCPPFEAFTIEIGPMTPTLCHLISTFSTNLFYICNFSFPKVLKGDHNLQLQVFFLVRERSHFTKKSSTKPELFCQKLD